MKHGNAITALALILAIGGCRSQDENQTAIDAGSELDMTPATTPAGQADFGQFDTNGDNQLDADEFGGWIDHQGWLNKWDLNGDHTLDQDEFASGQFGLWDTNRDSRISEAEWHQNAAEWFASGSYGDWSDWDANHDSYLDPDEFRSGLRNSGLFDAWDADHNGALDGDEFRNGWLARLDTNHDSVISADEWAAGNGSPGT